MDYEEYKKYEKMLDRETAFKNTMKILESCLNIKKEINEIEKINEEYDSNNIACFLNKKLKKYLPKDIKINFEQRQEELRSYSKQEENKVVYDNTFFLLIMDFCLMVFDWAYHDDAEDQEIYFNQLFYILNQGAVKHELIGQDNIVDIISGFDDNIIEVICCLGICGEIFIILHELAHIYLNHQVTAENYLSQELEADRVAFNILVDLINEQKINKNLEYDCFEEYCIIIPIIIFEFLEAVNKTNIYMRHKPWIEDIDTVLKRKEQVFDLIEEKQLDNDDAKNIYGYVGYIVDKYVDELKKLELVSVENYVSKNFILIKEIKKTKRETGMDFIIISHDENKLKGNYLNPKNTYLFFLKECITWIIDTYLGNTLLGIEDPIKQVLYLFFSIVKLSNINLSDIECKIILIMHDIDLYESRFKDGIPSIEFEQYMKSKLSSKYNIDVKIEDIKDIKEKFLKYKIFSERTNNICLREYIVYKK